MFLRQPPSEWTLLKVLGPWPWYIVSAAGVAIVLITLLDAPFWHSRRSRGAHAGCYHQIPTVKRVLRGLHGEEPGG